jgi:hypothetical protein
VTTHPSSSSLSSSRSSSSSSWPSSWPSSRSSHRFSVAALILLCLLAAIPGRAGRALAYDPATTHAGLTQRAAVASTLHAALAKRLNRPLGLFEPIVLRSELLPAEQGRLLASRLKALDPAGGYRPGDDGVATALAWTVAGSVIAWTPAERGQNSFFDPSRAAGLRAGGGLGEVGQSVRLLLDGGGSLRGWATGTNFNLTGAPSTEWVQSGENDLGLPAFHDQLELAVTGADRNARSTALARALLALGGVLAVLEDAGEPAHVRNDYRGAFLGTGGSGSGGPFNRGSAFERYVADGYGIGGVPAPGKPVSRANAISFVTASDGQGLADRTQRRFFSDGTVPEDGVVDRGTTPQEIVRAARESLVYGLPGIPRLELRDIGRKHYLYALIEEPQGRMVVTADAPSRARGAKSAAKPAAKPAAKATATETPAARPAVRRLLAYERVPGRVRFFLDRGVYQDTARAVLPEIGAYAAGLIDHLLRGEAQLAIDGATAHVTVAGARGAIRGGKLRVFAEDAAGARREIGSWPGPAVAGGQAIDVAIPAGTRVLAAVLRADDAAGALIAVAEQTVRP